MRTSNAGARAMGKGFFTNFRGACCLNESEARGCVMLDELATRYGPARRWVAWKLEHSADTGKLTKIPKRTNGNNARNNDTRSWSTLEAATAARDALELDGLGFCFDGRVEDDGAQIVGIDLDGLIDARGQVIDKRAAQFLRRARSLTELSQSGRGTHTWLLVRGGVHLAKGTGRARRALADVPGATPHKTPGAELFVACCFFAMTGRYFGTPLPLRTVTLDELRDILEPLGVFAADELEAGEGITAQRGQAVPRRAREIMRATHYASPSERDMALISTLANNGWSFGRVHAFITALPDSHVRRRLAANTPKQRLTDEQARAWVLAAFNKATQRGHRDDARERHNAAALLLSHIEGVRPGELTTRRAHETDLQVLRLHLETMAQCNRDTWALAVRDVELRTKSGVRWEVAVKAHHRLTAAGWLARVERHTLTQATTWQLGNAAHEALRNGASQSTHSQSETVCECVLCDADTPQGERRGEAKGRGEREGGTIGATAAAVLAHVKLRKAARAWRALRGVMLTPPELADALGVGVRTAQRHIELLTFYGLATGDGAAVTAITRGDVLARVADALGIERHAERRADEIDRERDELRAGYRKTNAHAAKERRAAHRASVAALGAHAMPVYVATLTSEGAAIESPTATPVHADPGADVIETARPLGVVRVSFGGVEVELPAAMLANLDQTARDNLASLAAQLVHLPEIERAQRLGDAAGLFGAGVQVAHSATNKREG